MAYPDPIPDPFFFAWANEDETFGPEHEVMDELILSATRVLGEGEKPLLEVEMINRRQGIIGPALKSFAWFAMRVGTEVVPLMLGRVVAAPVEVSAETYVVQFVAWPSDYKFQVQALAEAMKVLPYYDPVLSEIGKRDDPDTILEGWGKQWDVHETTHEVTAVGTTEGPDGNIEISDHFYDSLDIQKGETPKSAILVDMTATWTQTAQGVVDLGSHSDTTYSGDALLNDWPRPLAQMGGGWSVFSSDAVDAFTAAQSETVTLSNSWQNKEKVHEDGDTMSTHNSQTVPTGGKVGLTKVLTYSSQTGLLDPFATDGNGDPSPTNIPDSQTQTNANVMLSRIDTSLIARYVAERQRTERVVFLVRADVQTVVVDPLVTQDSETLTLNTVDVGVPLINLLNWTTISGQHVDVGQVIFPDNPQLPGGQSIQRATNSGTAGTNIPEFSDIPGEETVDGGVTWVSLGQANSPDNATDWTPFSHVNAGALVLPKKPQFISYALLVLPGYRVFPNQNVSVSEGQIIRASNGSYQVCTISGNTLLAEPSFSSTWGTVTNSGSCRWTSLGTRIPTGSTYQMCIQAGVTGANHVVPPFSETLHAVTDDNTAKWICIGTGVIPIGGVPGDVTASSYFTRDRGRQTLENAMLRARAKLLYSARCVEISFEIPYVDGIHITTRNTVTISDPRIPGGVAVGKVKTAELKVNEGAATCRVVIGCVVGKNNVIEAVDGDPVYVDDDYVEHDYQEHEGRYILLPTGSDLAYTPPKYQITDDGLIFPLTYSQVVLVNTVRGSLDDQSTAINDALTSMAKAANLNVFTAHGLGNAIDQLYALDQAKAMLNANSVSKNLGLNPIYVEYQLKPLNQPFFAVYHVKVSDFTMEKGIDLQTEVMST